MKNAILLHGMPDKDEYYDAESPSPSNAIWLPWLQKQLLIRGIPTQTPEMFNAWRPDYAAWRKEFERHDITPETILVGHSCGGGFLVRWLSEHPEAKVGKVVLVAPWLDPARDDTTDFFDFVIDTKLADRTNGITIFNSDNDYQSVQTSVKMIRDAVPNVRYREFHNYGHFTIGSMKTVEFSELLEEITK